MNTTWLRRAALAFCLVVCSLAPARAQVPANNDTGLTCSVFEQTMEVGIRDLPYEHSPFGLCLGNDIRQNAEGLISCRMFWRYDRSDDSHGVPTPRCEDLDFLSPTTEDVFDDDDYTSEGPTCLVRQVTQHERESGKSGWYYVSAAPQYCVDASSAAIVPTQRPDYDWQITMAWQCKSAMSIDLLGEVAYQDDLDQCIQPKLAPREDIGKACDRKLSIHDSAPTIELGRNECSSNICLTRPLGKRVCEQETDSPPSCRDADTVCTCRCAGEGPGPFCACPESFVCTPLLTSYGATPELAGGYCVPPRPEVNTPAIPLPMAPQL